VDRRLPPAVRAGLVPLFLASVLSGGACRDVGPSAGQAPAAPRDVPPADGELRVAVAAMVGPVATLEAYDRLLAHVASQLGRPYRLVQRRTYREVNDLLLGGELDLAFLCSGTFAALPPGAPVDVIAAPLVDGRPVYHSVVIVRDQDSYRTFDDLRGARFAFSDELSNTGHLYPRRLLSRRGEDPATFFGSTFFTGAHDRSILAVYRRLADAAAVHEVVFRSVTGPGTPYHGRLRVIDTSPGFPTPPVVAPTSVPAGTRARIREALLELHETPEGREVLATLGFTRFVPAASADYDPVRAMIPEVGGR